MRKPILEVNKERFIEWYFDKDTFKSLSQDVVDGLTNSGTYSINMVNIWDGLGYIPKDMILNPEVIFPNDLTIDYEISEPSQQYDVKFTQG